jgi:hypothetical protein
LMRPHVEQETLTRKISHICPQLSARVEKVAGEVGGCQVIGFPQSSSLG